MAHVARVVHVDGFLLSFFFRLRAGRSVVATNMPNLKVETSIKVTLFLHKGYPHDLSASIW